LHERDACLEICSHLRSSEIKVDVEDVRTLLSYGHLPLSGERNNCFERMMSQIIQIFDPNALRNESSIESRADEITDIAYVCAEIFSK
jgi:hypothetical protein